MAKIEIYKDNTEEIMRLATADLPYPKDLLLKISQLCIFKTINRTDYISTLELWEGKFLERIFAYKLDRRKKSLNQIIYKEVSRILENNSRKLIKDLYFGQMSGYHTLWSDKKIKKWYYYDYYTLDDGFKTTSYDSYCLSTYDYYCELTDENEKAIIKKSYYPHEHFKPLNYNFALSLDESIRYCGYNEKANCYRFSNFMNYISWYRAFPEIEMYSKLDLLHLITDSRFYNKFSKDKKFKSFILTNREYIVKKRVIYVDLIQAYKADKTLKRHFFEKHLKSIIKDYNITEEVILVNFEKIYNYIDNQSIRYYLDYFNAAKEFVSMKDKKHLMPNNLTYWHDYYIEKIEAKKRKDLEEGFNKVVKKWNCLNYKNKLFMIIVAPTQDAIIEEGKALEHCVGRMNYIEEMSKDNKLIMFIRDINNPTQSLYTVEYNKEKNAISQCRGFKNHQDERWDEVKSFNEEWLKKVPYLKRKKQKEEKVNESDSINREINQRPGTQANTERHNLLPIHIGC